MRQLIIAGNWKMHKDAQSTEDFVMLLLNILTHKQMRVLPLIAPAYPFKKALNILNGLP